MENINQENSTTKHYLLASDFDQTLSFNDSGLILSELLGVSGFEERVTGLSRMNLVQQGGELAYLILHDPEFRKVRREHLIEAGRRVRMKANIELLSRFLDSGIEGHRFHFCVISAAPQEVVQSALTGIIPPERIFGTELRYDPATGEVQSIARVRAGHGKVAAVDDLQRHLGLGQARVVYVGDGSSDVHVMLHVNRQEGYTIAVSQSKHVAQIARRTVLSDDAFSIVIPILEDIVGWDALRIRQALESHGFLIQEWGKVHTDWLTIRRDPEGHAAQG
jgi:phosphoserine phosphatase